MQVLISDANVIIDMEDCGLTDVMFNLPYQFLVPDILYYDELEDDHPELLSLGLKMLELSPQTLQKSIALNTCYNGPSRNDCLALAAAMQEACALLTGDKALRKAARIENIEVKGTIWLMEELLNYQLITTKKAVKAFDQMKEAGSRLPWDLVDEMLKKR